MNALMPARIFIHGLESSNQGTKAVYLRERYPEMIIPTFTGSLRERMEALEKVLEGLSGLNLIGSSFGGLMAALFALENEPRVNRVILLAPALNLLEFASPGRTETRVPAWIFHGRRDDVIPIEAVEPIAKKIFLDLHFEAVEDDHSLHQTFASIPWDKLLA